MSLSFVGRDNVDLAWPVIEPWLEAVEKRSKGRISAAQLREEVAAGGSQVWLWGEPPSGLAVTEIVQLPTIKICKVRIATGRNRRDWLGPGLAAIEKWAAENGCQEVEPHPRPGWRRELEALGYRSHHLEMRKEIDHA